MLSGNHRDHHTAERRAPVGNKVPVAKRGPGALRKLHHKLGLSWLWRGRALAGGCRGPFALNTPTGRAATSRAAHQAARGRRDLLPFKSGVCGQRSVLGAEWTLVSQTQHRTFIILICLLNDSYMRSARTVSVVHYRCWRIVLIPAVSMQPSNYADSFICDKPADTETRKLIWLCQSSTVPWACIRFHFSFPTQILVNVLFHYCQPFRERVKYVQKQQSKNDPSIKSGTVYNYAMFTLVFRPW